MNYEINGAQRIETQQVNQKETDIQVNAMLHVLESITQNALPRKDGTIGYNAEAYQQALDQLEQLV